MDSSKCMSLYFKDMWDKQEEEKTLDISKYPQREL